MRRDDYCHACRAFLDGDRTIRQHNRRCAEYGERAYSEAFHPLDVSLTIVRPPVARIRRMAPKP